MQSSNRTDFIKLCHVCVFTCVYVCTYMAAVGQHLVLLLSPILSFAAEPRAHQVASKVQGSPWFCLPCTKMTGTRSHAEPSSMGAHDLDSDPQASNGNKLVTGPFPQHKGKELPHGRGHLDG